MNFLAYFCSFFKGVIYGATPFFTQTLSESLDVLDILALRFLLSFVIIWLLKTFNIIKIGVKVKDFFVKNERTPAFRGLLLTAIFEPVLYMLFETFGISMTTGVTTAVILSLSPIIYSIAEFVFLKEYPTFMQSIFLGCGIFGAVYIAVNSSSTGGQDNPMGIVFLFLAVAVGALFCVFSRKSSSHFSAFEITYISCLIGAAAFNAVNVIRHIIQGDILSYFAPYFNLENLFALVFLGVISTIIATCMNNYALGKIQVSTSAAFSGVSTIVTVLIGVIFANEHLEYFHYIGFPFILIRMIGVSAISIMRDKKNKKTIEQTETKI